MSVVIARVAIVGGGVWGAAFGAAIGGESGCNICFWDREPKQSHLAAETVGGECHEHLEDAVSESDCVIIAVSSGGFSDVLKRLSNYQNPLLWLTKGFCGESRLLCETAAELLPSSSCFGAISGPTFASEVSRGLPAAMAIAVNHTEQLSDIQSALHRKMLRLYPSDDLVGVCVGGALKNIIAVAAGISDGMNLGANARAAMITRGLAEMRAFNRAIGGKDETINGIAGVGDLLLTSTSDLSRNRRLGLALGAGKPPPQGLTLEGDAAAEAVVCRAAQLGVEVPIIAAVCAVLREGLSPTEAVEMLLSRPPPCAS